MEDLLASLSKENEEVAEAISSCIKVDWRMQALIDIVNEYMDNSLVNLNFILSLRRCCIHGREFLSLISLALQQFDEEEAEGGTSDSNALDGQRYGKTLETLTKLMGAEDPFSEELLTTLAALQNRQISLLSKVKAICMKLDKKMEGKGVEVCRNILNAVVSATTMSVHFCSDGMAEVAVPPVARVVQAGASSVIGLMKGPKRKVSDREWWESANTIQERQYISAHDVDNLAQWVQHLKFELVSVKQILGLVTGGVTVKPCVEEMRRLYDRISWALENLEDHVWFGFSNIRQARAVLLRRMVEEISKRDRRS